MSDLNIFEVATRLDYEFTNFSFNGVHGSQYGLTAVSSGLNETSLTAPFEDKVIEVSGRDGSYYFGTNYKTQSFKIICAFDNLTSGNYRSICQWFNGKTIGRLIFDERPYKYYIAKLAATPSFSYIPFEVSVVNGLQHLFKGEVILEFTAFDPFAYSDYTIISDVPIWDGTRFTQWDDYPTNTVHFYDGTHLPGWYLESGLLTAPDANVYVSGAVLTTLSSGEIAKHFLNCGTVEVYPLVVVKIPSFTSGSGNLTISVGSGNIIEVASLQNLTGTNDTGTWTLTFNPLKGLATATTTDTDYAGITYNIAAIHTGTFFHLEPGINHITLNKAVSELTLTYKHKYL
jgi:phage-related protein